jgi:preprotein translocase subunit YajC
MSFLWLIAQASTTPSEGGGGPPVWGSMLVPLAAFLLFMYLLVIRPQRTQEKQRQEMLGKLKRNDKIVNSGGIIGVIDSIKDKDEEVVLKGGLRITRSSIVRVVTSDETSKE